MPLTEAQVNELAPDTASAAAGKQLAKTSQWMELGQSERAIWGRCRGSAVYHVKVDVRQLGYHCTCPSRKFPCKHVLGLLFLNVAGSLPNAEVPAWAAEWLEKRQIREEKKSVQTSSSPTKPSHEAASRKRAEQRADRVREGLDRLDLWLCDLVRNGLAGLESRPFDFWNEQAKRLVDSQAPGLANRVQRLGSIPASGPDWPIRLLEEMGRIKLIIHAYQRIEQLSPDLASELRQIIGWNVSMGDLEREGEPIIDHWQAIGQWVDDEDRIRAQRTWVIGKSTKRSAMILQFAPNNQPFAEPIVPGMEWNGTLIFYPGASRQRARLGPREHTMEPSSEPFDSVPAWSFFFQRVSEAVSRQPWTTAVGGVVSHVRWSPGTSWAVVDREQHSVPILGANHWRLFAVSGGHEVDLAGEWDGKAFRPLGMWFQGEYWPA